MKLFKKLILLSLVIFLLLPAGYSSASSTNIKSPGIKGEAITSMPVKNPNKNQKSIPARLTLNDTKINVNEITFNG